MAAVLLCFCAFTNEAMGQTWNIGNPGYNSNVKATLSGNTLTISGSGNMVDFWDSTEGEAPWWFNSTHRASIQTVVIQENVTNIGNRAFKDCGNLRTVRIESPVYIIGRQAFLDCTNLKEITIPNSVTEIEGEAFKNCSNLQTVKIENGSQELKFSGFIYNGNEYPRGWKYEWFDGCPIQTLHIGSKKYTYDFNSDSSESPFRRISTLLTLTIGNTVNEINGRAFANCTNLSNVTIENGPNDLTFGSGGNYFNQSPIKTLHLGRNIVYNLLPESIPFREKTSLTTLTIGNNVGTIGDEAFYGCSGLSSAVTIPNSVRTIGESAFNGCVVLPMVTIGTNVETIGASAFNQCRALTSIVIPQNVNFIDGNAFANCDCLSNVTIEDSPRDLTFAYTRGGNYFNQSPIKTLHLGRNITYTSVASYIPFSGKISLTTLIIGNNVSSIGYEAFLNCTGLTTITSQNPTPPTTSYNCFYGINKTTCTVNVPQGSKCAYKEANFWKEFININDGTNSSCSNGIDNAVANQLQIYPNPAKDEIFIKTEIPIEKVEIYSLAGALLLSENNFAEKITVSTLPHGIYLLKVYTDKGVAVSKVVKE